MIRSSFSFLRVQTKAPLLLEAKWWRWRDAIPSLVSKACFKKGVVPCFVSYPKPF